MEAFFDSIKAANIGIHQLNFPNMSVFTYINVCNEIFHASVAFGSTLRHFHHTESVTAAGSWSRLGGQFQKNKAFTQPLNNRDLKSLSKNRGFVPTLTRKI